MAGSGSPRKREEEEEDDVVCLDPSFFVDRSYEMTTFTFGSHVLNLLCLRAASSFVLQSCVFHCTIMCFRTTFGLPHVSQTVVLVHQDIVRPEAHIAYDQTCEGSCSKFLSLADYDLTGQLVWPGAVLMNNYLSEHPETVRGCSLIELGSGVGITGILCSRFCKKVVMTDHNDEVLEIINKNIEMQSCGNAVLTAEKLEWGNYDHINNIIEKYPVGFDIVLGADICFQQSSISPLFNSVEKIMQIQAGKCRFILAYVSRAKVMDVLVLKEAEKRGMHVKEVEGTRRTISNLEGVIYDITLK